MTRCYPAYKDSGVEWLGEVPEGWEVSPLKHVADFINGSAFKPETWSEVGTPIIRIENLNGGTDFNCYDGEVNERYIVNQGDILFGWSGNRGTSFGPFIWATPGRFYLNQHIFNVQGYSCDRIWFYWCLRAVTEYVEQQAHGIIGMVHVTKGNLGAVNIPLPPLPEQTAIAAFLDRETAKIDALVAEQRRLIDLMREKRQAVISHAVTKGLNPGAPLKPSGIDWLGDVPEGWEVLPIKSVAKLAGRIGYRGYTTADIVEEGEGAITLSPSNIRGGVVSFEKSTFISWSKYHESPEIQLAAQDVVMVKTGSTFGKVGYVPDQAIPPGTINPQLVIFKEISCLPEYLFLSLNADHIRSLIEVSNTGGTIPTMTQEAIGNFRVALPSHQEQQMIVDSVKRITAKLDTLIATAETAIALLQERRAALISAAVTGKIDVRHLSPAATEAA